MSDRIAVMRGGRVAQMGTADELYNRPADSFVARFLDEIRSHRRPRDGPR